MDPRDNHYKSNFLDINEIDFAWVEKTNKVKYLREAMKLIEHEGICIIRLL